MAFLDIIDSVDHKFISLKQRGAWAWQLEGRATRGPDCEEISAIQLGSHRMRLIERDNRENTIHLTRRKLSVHQSWVYLSAIHFHFRKMAWLLKCQWPGRLYNIINRFHNVR